MSDPEVAADALRWLRYAHADLRLVRLTLADDDADLAFRACFNAQQAAEKALKAALVLEQIEVPFIHDLLELRGLVPDSWPGAVQPEDLRR